MKPCAPSDRRALSPRVTRVAGAAAAVIARWESGLVIGAGSARDLFECHGVSGLVDELRDEAAREGDARPATLLASQRATESVSIASIRGAETEGVRDRLRTEAGVGGLRLDGWRHRRRIRRAIRRARKDSERIARRCEKELGDARHVVVAADLRAEAFGAITEACSEAWRAIEAEEVGEELERLKREIQEIHQRGLDRVRARA